MEACGSAYSISCFQDDLSVLKAFTLKIFKCHNIYIYFWVTSLSIKLFCSFSEANQATMLHRAPFYLWQGFWIHPCFFFSTLEVRLSGCLATCHPERLLHNANSLVMPTLALLPEESWNYHVLRALILSCQNFHIYDNYSAVWLFHVIVTVCLSLYDNFCNYNGKEKRCKVKI